MPNCIFCLIASGQAPAARVLETPGVLAFLDIAPVHYGHTLVIPREHYPTMLELPDDLWREMGSVSRQVAKALGDVLEAQGFNISMNNFPAAGQAVPHVHLHVVPRYFQDGLQLFPHQVYRPGDLEKTAARLRQILAPG